jgi:hypothetical protein
MSMGLHIALVHHPVLSRTGDVVTTAITSLDIHDVARSARTYGAQRTYMVTPITQQRALVEHVFSHWLDNPAHAEHPRTESLRRGHVAASVDEVIEDLRAVTGSAPYLVATSAKRGDGDMPYAELRKKMRTSDGHALLLFGTGWGLAHDLMARADAKLAPLVGEDDYNHLSVRAAVAVVLDRLRGS